MKQRTFLTTLILFLFAFNIGIALVCVTTFKDIINRAKERSIDEHSFIVSAITKDFTAVESREGNIETSFDSIIQPYNYLSRDQKVILSLYKDNNAVYSIGREFLSMDNIDEPSQDGSLIVETQNIKDNTYVIVSGNFPVPYESYLAVYMYDITDSVTTWKEMKNLLFFVGFILSSLLSLCLLILLNRLFKPLLEIAQTSLDIASGSYDTRLPISGNDELAKMSLSFNHMADEIKRQMNELMALAESKQQFIDNFSHELRTPIAAIYGYAEYIQKAALTEEDRFVAVDFIMQESKRIQTMSHQLLDLANFKNEHINLKEQKISKLFEAVGQTLDNRLVQKDIQIEFITEIDTILGDAYLLQSLLENLVDNAIKACNIKGMITVSAFMENHNKLITVKDNGKGMDSKDLLHITEPFYRAEKSRSRKDGSAGLGLSICNQIALIHNATLTFSSYLDAGTTVKITFTN